VVGEEGFIASSSNGTDWIIRTSGVAQNLNRVAWVADRYWVVGDGGKVLSSVNGSSWQSQSSGATNTLAVVTGTTNTLVLAGDREVRLRQGTAWTNELRADHPWPPPIWSYYAGCWNEFSHWLVGESGMIVQGVKMDGAAEMSWVVPTNSVRNWLWSVMRNPGYYLAVGDRGTIMASNDGFEWEVDLVPSAATNVIFLGVGGRSNLVLAVGSGGTILHGTNGVTWELASPSVTTNDLQAVTEWAGLLVVAGAKGTLLISTNGVNWALRPVPTANFLSGLASHPNGLVAVGDGGVILGSPDGKSWNSRPASTTNWLWQVRWLNGTLLAVGENGTIVTSPDGQTWTRQNSGTSEWLTDAAFIGNTWYVVGTYGIILTSTNLTQWTPQAAATRKTLFGATSNGGQLLAVGAAGIILRCQVVPDRSPVQFVNYGRIGSYNLYLLGGKPGQQFWLKGSPDLQNWQPSHLLEFLDGSGTLMFLDGSASTSPREYYAAPLNLQR
jgi:hypothetical protein